MAGNTEIPGDASIKISVHYQGIQIEYLKTHYNCTLIFNLPDILRNAGAQGGIMSGQTNVGNLTVDNGKVKVQFNEGYLNELKKKGTTTIDGDFYVTGKANLSRVPDEGKTTINIAGKDYILNFGENPIAHYGKVDVKKSCEKLDLNSDYIKYTITVNAGEDGCPDVKVVDTFTGNQDLVTYVGVTTNKKDLVGNPINQEPYETIDNGKQHGSVYLGTTSNDTTPIPEENTKKDNETGSLVWAIGDMSANEKRTLTYFAKLKDGVALNGKTINNQAVVYSKSIKRVYFDNKFTPNVDYDMSKERVGSVVRQDDGSYKIDYKLYFKLKENNSNYPIKDFEMYDFLDYYKDFFTDENIRQYVTYDLNSVKLFKNNVSEDTFKVSWAKNKDDYKANWNVEVDGKPTRFKITGTDNNPIILNPGDTIYATYSVIVTPEAFAKIQNNSVAVKNRYLVKASNTNNRADDWALDKFWHIENINTYKWDAKSVGSAIAKDTTIQMSGNKYIKNNGKYNVDNSTENTFKVPKGSYPYTVMVNDTLGDWDATSVQMTDNLNSNKMQYVGYVKIEALEVKQNGSSLASTGDYEKTNTLDRTYESKGVKWVKIDGDTSFTLKPSDLGWENNKYAYRFTYYAKPVNQDSYGNSKVTNTFTLTGNVVGRDGIPFKISDIASNKEVAISGNYKMNVKKSSWYYESPKVDNGN